MNILFYCPFKFSLKSKNIKSLGGIESVNVELAKYLANTKNKIYLASFCNGQFKNKNLTNLPVSKLKNKNLNIKFDKIISSNDPTIFDYLKNSQNFLWLHNKLSIEKALRKKKFFSIFRNKISTIFVSNYLLKKTTNIYNFKKKFVIPNFLDPTFYNIKRRNNRKPYFIWSVQRKKGLQEIINIWSKKIYPINSKAKLYIFGINKNSFSKNDIKIFSSYNIFLKGRVSKNELKTYYNISMGMICLGYDETFCINAIEAFSCGLPLITFGFTAVNELINNKNSFKMTSFNEFDKKIFNILDMDKFQRQRYTNYCYNFSKKYQIQKIIPLWKKVLNF